MKKIIKEINETMYRIPAEYCTPEKAMAYIEGMTAGRKIAIEIIEEFSGIKKEPPSPKG
jgi:hypothetical protein